MRRYGGVPFATVVVVFACGASTSGCGPSSFAPGDETTVSQSTKPLSEEARIRSFLDARYATSDVWHTFESKEEQLIDCIDFYAQPGVKALVARGVGLLDLDAIPKRLVLNEPSRTGRARAEQPVASSEGRTDALGRPRVCPENSVPMVRLTAEEIQAAGGLDAYERLMSRKEPPAGSSGAPDPGDPSHAYSAAKVTGTFRYAGTVASIAAPSVPDIARDSSGAGSHSLSQIWVSLGTTLAATGCVGSGCIQTVEAGWTVDPVRFHTSSPVFFNFSTSDGYKTGCYNNTGSNCAPWVGLSSTLTLGKVLSTTSSVSTGRNDLVLLVANYDNVGWALYAADYNDTSSNNLVGYWPASDYWGQFELSADAVQVGGEVYEPSLSKTFGSIGQIVVNEMGTGANASAGYSTWNWSAAYHRSFFACPTVATCNPLYFDPLTPGEPSSYDLTNLPAAGGTDWGPNWFYYGNQPDIFWQQNFPPTMSAGFSPWATSAPAGSYRGECPDGQSVNGISMSSTHIAHSIHCGGTYRALSASCYTLPLGTSDNRKTDDGGWNWDPGYTKVECNTNEFVEGVSQTSSGVLNGVLCCPTAASLPRGSLGPVVFYGGNAGLPGIEHDWDVGYSKGSCAPTAYVSGISKLASSSQGTVGAIHAILCGG